MRHPRRASRDRRRGRERGRVNLAEAALRARARYSRAADVFERRIIAREGRARMLRLSTIEQAGAQRD